MDVYISNYRDCRRDFKLLLEQEHIERPRSVLATPSISPNPGIHIAWPTSQHCNLVRSSKAEPHDENERGRKKPSHLSHIKIVSTGFFLVD